MYQTFDELGFKPGDKVRKKDGTTFSNGEMVVTVKGWDFEYEAENRVALKETGTHIEVTQIEKVETEMEFKVGDKVKKKDGSPFSDGNFINTIREPNEYETYSSEFISWVAGGWIHNSMIELAFEYEDQWHLNDGKVTIPDDADKLEKDGSVVAFRKRKQPEFKFGDMVKHKSGYIYVVVGKDQEGLYRVIGKDASYSVTIFADSLTKI